MYYAGVLYLYAVIQGVLGMLRSIRFCLISVVRLLSSQSLAGGFYSGSDLASWCKSEKKGMRGRCIGYIMGAVDSMLLVDGVKAAPLFCMEGSGELDVVTSTLAFLEETPESKEYLASDVILQALDQNYGCHWAD